MLLPFAAGLLLLFGLAWRFPTASLLLALASLSLGAQWLLAGHLPRAVLPLVTEAQKAVVVVALAGNMLRFGLRASIPPWPLLAVLLLLLETALLAPYDPAIEPRHVALSTFGLAAPWLFAHVRLAAGARRRYAAVMAATAPLCVAAGLVLAALGHYPLMSGSRLQGATNAGWLSMLGYAGFAIALHEAARSTRPAFGYLAALNLAIVILSGGRMGILACVAHGLVYALVAESLRHRFGRPGRAALIGGAAVATTLVFAFPMLHERMLGGSSFAVNMSGREGIWSVFWSDFLGNPVFGSGLGAATAVRSYFDLPHNDYLRLLVEGGMVGFAVFAAAVLLWGRAVLRSAAPADRGFAVAAFTGLAAYATTDNVLTLPPAILVFAYLGALLAAPARARAEAWPERADEPAAPPAPSPGAGAPAAPWHRERARRLDTRPGRFRG